MPFVEALYTYPIKSCRGISAPTKLATLSGLTLDRWWMIVDENGKFITQREEPRLALVIPTTHVRDDLVTELHISVPANQSPFVIDTMAHLLRQRPDPVEVTVWKDTCFGMDEGDVISELLSDYLGRRARLVRKFPDRFLRETERSPTVKSSRFGFADGYPYLVLSSASLGDLNARLDHEVTVQRFRPNIVIGGCEPHEEDTWKKIRIGKVFTLVAMKPCARCVITTVNQSTGEKAGKEPLRTLASYRKTPDGVIFGMNYNAINQSFINIGDEVEILLS